MFDFSFFEFLLAAAVALVVLGPERLPGALRTAGLWLGRLRRSYYNVKTEIEREIGMDEVRRQLHNEQVMADVQRVEREVRALGTATAEDLETAVSSPTPAAAEGRQALARPAAAAGSARAEPVESGEGGESGGHGERRAGDGSA